MSAASPAVGWRLQNRLACIVSAQRRLEGNLLVLPGDDIIIVGSVVHFLVLGSGNNRTDQFFCSMSVYLFMLNKWT